MSEEFKNIGKNNSAEIPKGLKSIIKVSGIQDAKEKLEDIKALVTTFIENQQLGNTDSQWETLLPEKFIKFITSLEEKDFANDDILQPTKIIIYHLKDRTWEWYSSKAEKDLKKLTK